RFSAKKIDNRTTASVSNPVTKRADKLVAAHNRANADPVYQAGHAESAACRYIRSSAESEAAIISSPTLSASSDDDGSGSVAVAMNLFDFKKSQLVRDSANARCRVHEASKKLEATLSLGVEATRFARSWAKQEYIRSQLGNLGAVRREAASLVDQGMITRQDADQISLQIAGLKAEMARAKAEANRRSELPALRTNDVKSRHGALVQATRDLQEAEREIRTNDALELSVSAGYRYNDEFNDTLQRTDAGGGFAKVSVGVRLGAFSQQRRQHEADAANARLESLFEENTGIIWKSGFSNRATKRMLEELRVSERELSSAYKTSTKTISRLSGEDRPEIVRAMLSAKIDRVKIGAERAAVRAAIAQLQRNQTNISALSE
ncbi:MAG: hypothetical protein AAF412_14065, partial [Pseudomonadota bacterium]